MAEADADRERVGRADLTEPHPSMKRAAFRRSGAEPQMSRLIPRLAAFVLAGSMLCPIAASAGSVIRIDDVATASQPKGSVAVAKLRAPTADPAACARDFHARLKSIAEGPFQSVKAALAGPAESARASSPGEGGMIFPPNARSRGTEQTAALRAAMAAAKGVSGVAPRDANAKWTATRIREDLGDFLTQGPSPYLCSGIEAYLTTLKRFASQVSVSPDRRQRVLETAQGMARTSLAEALLALRPVPVPTAAPEDRGAPAESAPVALQGEPGAASETPMGPPMLVAVRDTGATRISEGDGVDSDLPPLKAPREHKLDTSADVGAAVSELGRAIREASTSVNTDGHVLDTTTTASTAALIGPMQPAREKSTLEELAELKPFFAPDGGFTGDARLRLTLMGALSDLEAVDRLIEVSDLPEDPLGAAFAATFDAIETAHAESCRCKL